MKHKNKLHIRVQAVDIGNTLWKEDINYMAAFVDNKHNQIAIDNYNGTGASYKRRDNAAITITKGSENYTFHNFDALFNVVKAYFKKLD